MINSGTYHWFEQISSYANGLDEAMTKSTVLLEFMDGKIIPFFDDFQQLFISNNRFLSVLTYQIKGHHR